MSFVEDFTPLLADFGVDGTLAGQPVRGIFDDAYGVASIGPRGMATTGPQYALPTAGIPASPYGAALVVPGKGNYTVIEHQPDGTGWSVLLLERAA